MNRLARRYNSGKLRYELLPNSLKHIVEVYTKGAHKYSIYKDSNGVEIKGSEITIDQAKRYELKSDGAENWRSGLSWIDTLGSLKRHIAAFENGEDYDKDLGTLHLANAAFNILALLEFSETHPELDDRIVRTRISKIGLDIDGVICNFAKRFSELEHMSSSHWDIGSQTERTIRELNKSFWLSLEPLVDGDKLGFVPSCYITKRYGCKPEWIEEWLAIHKFPIAPIIVTEGGSKVKAAKKMQLDFFVEDNYYNYMELNSNGITCFLLDAFHNKKYDVGYKRIYSLDELTERFAISG